MVVLQVIGVFAAYVVVPAFLLYTLWNARPPSRYDWMVKVIHAGLAIATLFLIGRWDWVSYYLRYLIVGAFLVVVVFSYRNVSDRPFTVGEGIGRWMRHRLTMIELVVFLVALVFTFRGRARGKPAVELRFPLQDGRYYVAHGGKNLTVNMHSRVKTQQYALDIVELNPVGLRAGGLLPGELDRYEIFGDTVVSPCRGEVTAARGGMTDLIPPERDDEHITGNHIVLACKDVRVLLAHLKQDSLQVEEGDQVAVGQPLGRVGNTGNSTEPHLHIHAVAEGSGDVLEGDPVPLQFQGDYLVRNELVTR